MQRYGWIVLGALVLILALVNGGGGAVIGASPAVSPTWTRVAPPTLTPTPSATLPVTTTPITRTTPAASVPAAGPGAMIWLRVQCSAPCQAADVHWQELWTGVQWQDAAGNWHDVEGWRGPLDEVTKGEGRKVWGLSEALYGAGPFRWVVYQSQQGEVLVASESFDLPDYTGKVSRITVEIGP